MSYNTYVINLKRTREKLETLKNFLCYSREPEEFVGCSVYHEDWPCFVDFCITQAIHRYIDFYIDGLSNYDEWDVLFTQFVEQEIGPILGQELDKIVKFISVKYPAEPIKLMILDDSAIVAIRTKEYGI